MEVNRQGFFFDQPIFDIVDAIHVRDASVSSRRPPAVVRPAIDPPEQRSPPTSSRAGGRSRTRKVAPPAPQLSRPKFKPTSKENVNIACPVRGCSYIAQSPRHMVRHSTTHTGERPFPCTYPGYNYRGKQREHLRTHELTHSDLKPFSCMLCDFATKRKEHLTRHLKRHAVDGLGALREQ